METTILYWGSVGKMEKFMETTIFGELSLRVLGFRD